MVANRKVTGTAVSMPAGLAMGSGVSLLVTLGGAAIFANLISREVLKETSIGYCAIVLILLSSLLGAAVAVTRIKRRRVYVCALTGVIYYGVLLAATAMFFGGQYTGMGVTALLVLAGCGTVALLGLRKEKARYPRRNKIKHR